MKRAFTGMTVAAIAAAMPLGAGHLASAENLSGLHIGDTRATAIAKLGRPKTSERAGSVNLDAWTLGDHNRLSITSRASDGSIVYMESDWQDHSDLTDFPGLLFGRTTRAQLIAKFGTGVVFKNHFLPWKDEQGSMSFTQSYELQSHPLVIVSFVTKASTQSLKSLAERGKKYFVGHLGDQATLDAIILSDPDYLQAIWGEMGATKGTGSAYKRLEPFAFQPEETPPAEVASTPANARQGTEIPLQYDSGELHLHVMINETLEVPFILDTGATSMQIPEDVYSVLERQGTITPDDAQDPATVSLADGSLREMGCFRIHELKVGDRVISNLRACVSPTGSDPLLGQAFLAHLGRYTIDNERHVLVLE